MIKGSQIFYITLLWMASSCMDSAPSEHDKLMEIISDNENFEKTQFPALAERNNRLPSMTEASVKERANFAAGIMERLQALDRSQLDFEDEITLELLLFIQEDVVAQYELKGYLNPILADEGFHIAFAFTPEAFSFTSKEDYEDYLGLLQSFPAYVAQHITLMRKGLETGMVQPKIILEGYEVTYDNHIVSEPVQSLFYQPFTQIPDHFSEADKEDLSAKGKKAVMEGAVAGYRLFSDFMTQEFIPGTRSSIGASELPDGAAFYQQRIKYYTTLSLSPDSIHRLGLAEVARIRAEMQAIIEEVNFKGSFAEFLTFLRTDPQFYATTPDQLLKEAAWIAKSMDGKLPKLFGKLPRQPYTVKPVPAHLAPKYTSGRYSPGSLKANQPGQYWVNTYALENRPLYVLEALSFHEAVPGHHLQEALCRELTHLPEFRQALYLSAYGEGWGLYSEYLGVEAGFYQNPYSRFGRLTYEMWRACRLVVDTGIHAKRWTRQQVMDYMAAHTALSLHEITTETDRYISWPAQALSYKIGELKIKALRRKAEKALGSKFDVRLFHDLILSHGTVTLEILERMVDQYISEQSKD